MLNKLLQKKYLIASFFIPFSIYLFTLSPSVSFGDTGELIVAAYTLGIPHPPGSPIWVTLAHFFTYLPINEVAWRVNLSSAFFGALTISIQYLLLKKILKNFLNSFEQKSNPLEKLSKKQKKKNHDLVKSLIEEHKLHFTYLKKFIEVIALSSSLILSFTLSIWSDAVIAEVYTLNSLFTVSILYLLVLYQDSNKYKYLYLGALLTGLAVTNHYLIFLLIPAILIWILLHNRNQILNFRVISILLFMFILGTMFFLYLPIRSAANPPIDWGNPETLEKTLDVIQRTQFGGNKTNNTSLFNLPIKEIKSGDDIFTRTFDSIGLMVMSTFTSFSIMAIFGYIGIFFGLKYLRKKIFLVFYFFIIASAGLSLLIKYKYNPADRFTILLPAFVTFTVFISIGVVYLSHLLIKKRQYRSDSIRTIVKVFLLAIPIYFLITNFKTADRSKNNVAYIHAKKMLELVDKNAIIFSEENNWIFPLLYVSVIEDPRPDVTIIDRNGNIISNEYSDKLAQAKSDNDFERTRRTMELDLIRTSGRPAYYAVDKSFENYGYQSITTEGILYKEGKPKNIDFATYYLEILNIPISEFDNYFLSEYMISFYHFQYAERLIKLGKIEEAVTEFQLAEKWVYNDARMLNNIGIKYIILNKLDLGKKALKNAIKVDPNNYKAQRNLGLVYDQLGDIEKAEEQYIKAITINGQYIEALIDLSSVYERTGDIQKAVDGYKFALQLDPKNFQLRQKIEVLESNIN